MQGALLSLWSKPQRSWMQVICVRLYACAWYGHFMLLVVRCLARLAVRSRRHAAVEAVPSKQTVACTASVHSGGRTGSHCAWLTSQSVVLVVGACVRWLTQVDGVPCIMQGCTGGVDHAPGRFVPSPPLSRRLRI